nr:UDP-4-amino-4,6-dideoxy-N-acetyl-beta-L-altrosamine N-acetyltransferase [Paludibacter sp.]
GRGGGGGVLRRRQPPGGTYHRSSDKLYFNGLLLKGWETPVSEILGQGIFYLRAVRLDDRVKIYDWRNSPDVARYMYSDHQISKEEHERWFDAAIKDPRRKCWVIVYNKEEVGLVNLTDIDAANKRGCYASYIVREDLRNRSIGTLAEYYILRYFFEDLGFNKICAEVFTFNRAGINVHKSLGFQEEGLFRQHRIKNGEFADVVALAMLRSEWDEKKPEIENKLKTKGLL